MAESKKETFTKAEFLTETKFAKKYGIPKELVTKTVLMLYKTNKQVKAPSGVMTPVVVRNRASHGSTSRYLIHPLFHDVVLDEVKKQEKILAKQAKSVAHEI